MDIDFIAVIYYFMSNMTNLPILKFKMNVCVLLVQTFTHRMHNKIYKLRNKRNNFCQKN